MAVAGSASTCAPVQLSSVRTTTPPRAGVNVQTWTPRSMRRPSPIAGPVQRMHRSGWIWPTVDVMTRVVAGGGGGAGARGVPGDRGARVQGARVQLLRAGDGGLPSRPPLDGGLHLPDGV